MTAAGRLAIAVVRAVAAHDAAAGPHGSLGPAEIDLVTDGAHVRDGADVGQEPSLAYRPPEWFLT